MTFNTNQVRSRTVLKPNPNDLLVKNLKAFVDKRLLKIDDSELEELAGLMHDIFINVVEILLKKSDVLRKDLLDACDEIDRLNLLVR